MQKTLLLISLLFVICGCKTYTIDPISQSKMELKMTEKSFISSNGISFVYRIYVPNVARQIPIIFYLHGAGQRGIDNKKQLDDALGSLMSITQEKDEYTSIIVAPQCPNDVFWRDDEILEALSEFIVTTCNDKVIDKSRIYITGYSMGGDATWKLAIKYPDIFSTAVPICGGPLSYMEPDRPDVPKETSELNIWAFNNFDDSVVRPDYSKYIFSKIWNYRINDNLNFTESIDGGHNAINIYRNRKYMIWMLSTRKE